MCFQKIYKKYYSSSTARHQGTLANLKSILHRTNVNGVVKSTNGYEPHKDFATLIAR